MKWIIVELACVCFVFSLCVIPPMQDEDLPSAEEIIEKNIEAAGGEMALLSVETLHTKSTVEHISGSQTWESIETFWKNSNWVTHYNRSGGTGLKVGCHNGRIWRSNGGDAYWVDDETAAIYKHVSRNPALAIQWREFDGEIAVEAVEEVEGKKACRMEFRHSDGTSITRWFDVESGLIVKTRLPISNTWQVITSSDFRVVEGMTYPWKLKNVYAELDIEFETTMEKIDVNGDFDDSRVALPKSLAEED